MKIAAPADFSVGTRRQVARLLAEHGELTVPQIADHLHLTTPAVRRHIEALVVGGEVAAVEDSVDAGRGRGRPPRRYHLTAAGRESLGSTYDTLAADALSFLADVGGRQAVRRFAHQRAEAMEARYAAALACAATSEKIPLLIEMLRTDGFLAESHDSAVCQHHCPVSGLAGEFPELCEAELAMFARLLGAPVRRERTIPEGASGCVTLVGVPSMPSIPVREESPL